MFFSFLVFRDRVSCIALAPGTHFVDQAGLKLRNPPASPSQVLGLKACATTARLWTELILFYQFIVALALRLGGSKLLGLLGEACFKLICSS